MRKCHDYFRSSINVLTGVVGVLFFMALVLQGCKTANVPDSKGVELLNSGSRVRTQTQSDPPGAPVSDDAIHPVVAYYFHRTIRCPGCLQIEFMAGQAIQDVFEQELKDGRLAWLVLDMEEPGNQGLVDQYDLETSTFVLVDSSSAGNGRWKKLEKVWNLKDDPDGFRRYIEQEVAGYLTKK
ncbi:MAG: nitrophenyl compound nitroreductase subunit ArsF family protein [Phycisphaerae bacterium]|nr:nitrophenyl compound nitroreductase subunit ArsF family protein [Phycisphaerae bacterium]